MKKLQDAHGVVHTGIKEMGAAATSYFKNLFAADPSIDHTPVIEFFEQVITPEVNEGLCAEFTDKEIVDALFQIGPFKAPGPDGFPAHFFQRNWATMKESIFVAVKDFFHTGIMPLVLMIL